MAITIVFALDVAALFVLLAGGIWSIARPERRLWPPPARWRLRGDI